MLLKLKEICALVVCRGFSVALGQPYTHYLKTIPINPYPAMGAAGSIRADSALHSRFFACNPYARA